MHSPIVYNSPVPFAMTERKVKAALSFAALAVPSLSVSPALSLFNG